MRKLIAGMLLLAGCRGQVSGVRPDPRVLRVPQGHKSIQAAVDTARARGLTGLAPKDSVIIEVDSGGRYEEKIIIYAHMRVVIRAPLGRVMIEGGTRGNTFTVLKYAKLTLENLATGNEQPRSDNRTATILVDSLGSLVLRHTTVATKSIAVSAVYRNSLDLANSEFIGTGAVGVRLGPQDRNGAKIQENEFVNLDLGIDDSCSRYKPKLSGDSNGNSNRFRNVRVARVFGANHCN